MYEKKLIMAILAIVCHGIVLGQGNKDSVDYPLLSLEELMNINITTATKSSARADEVPSIVEIITRDQIRQRGFQNLAQVLNTISDNHEDKSNWGIGEPVHQNVGFGFRFDTGQNILFLFNGQRLNAFLPGNRFGGEEYLLDNIERIEIVRGPGSALYGANAFTAIVNIISRNASEDQFEARTSLNYIPTSNGFVTSNSFITSTPSSGTISGAVRYFTEQGQKLSVNNSLFGNAILRDGVNHAVDGEFFYNEGSLNIYSKLTNQSRNTFTGFNSSSPSDMDDLTLSTSAYSIGSDYTFDAGDKIDLKLSAGWHQDNWTEVALVPVFQVTPDGQALVRDDDGNTVLDNLSLYRNGEVINTSFFMDGQGADTRSLDSEIQFTYNYTKNNNIIAGVYLSEDRILRASRPTELNLDPLEFVPFRIIRDDANNWLFDTHATRKNTGLYAQTDYAIKGKLFISAGARLDLYSGTGALQAQKYSEFNPKGGLVYASDNSGTFKLLYGRATRIPNGFETLSAVTILGNPSLSPERIGTLQFTWIKNWSNDFRTEFGGFHSEIKDKLETNANISEPMQANGFVGQFVNISSGQKAVNNGIDGKIMYKIRNINTSVNFTNYFGSDDGKGNAIAYIPTTMINGNINVPIGIVNVNFGFNYRGKLTQPAEDTREPVKAYFVGRMNIIISPARLPVDFTIGGRNIFNASYQSPSSSKDYVNHFPTRGAEFIFGIAYTGKR